MKYSIALLLASTLLFPVVATAGDLTPYSTLIVRDPTTDGALIANVPPDVAEKFSLIRQKMVDTLADDLVAQLKGSFQTVRRSGEQGRSAGKSVVIEERFTAIDAGRRGLRMWIGFSGTAAATLQAKVVDGASGRVLAVFEQSHSAPLGWAGSERVLLQICKQLAGDLAEFVKKLR